MHLPAEFIPTWLAFGGWLIFAPLVVWNLLGAPWPLLRRNLVVQVYLFSVLVLIGLWSLRFASQAGLSIHFLGLTAMVLMFGWRLALVGGAAALLALVLTCANDARTLGVVGLISVALPVMLARALHAQIYRRLPKHYVVYIIVSAHFSSMALIATVMLANAALLWLLGVYQVPRLIDDYLLFLPIAMLPEGFLNGALLAMLTAWKPEWVRSFDDRDYIEGK